MTRAPGLHLASLLAASALLLLAACRPAVGIAVEEAWIRAVPPGASATAGYFRLANGSGDDRVLEAVTADGLERVEIHETTMTDGVMRMRRLDGVTIPAGETLAFAPGGRHLMLFGKPLPAAGSTLILQLRFADGEVLAVEAPVRRGAD